MKKQRYFAIDKSMEDYCTKYKKDVSPQGGSM